MHTAAGTKQNFLENYRKAHTDQLKYGIGQWSPGFIDKLKEFLVVDRVAAAGEDDAQIL